jgi:hypothetical protein
MITPAGSFIENPSSGSGGGGSVSSVFGRTGTIVAQSFDYFLVGGRQEVTSADGVSTTLAGYGDSITLATAGSVAMAATTTSGAGISYFQNVAGTVTSVSGTTNYVAGRNIGFWFQGFLNRITDTRLWFGVTNQTAATMGGSDNPAGSYAAFRFSTFAGDTVWQCITKDGTTQNVQSSGVAPVVNATQTFVIEFDDTVPNIRFYINGTLVATSTAHVPASGTLMRFALTETWALTNTNSALNFSQLRMRSDF